MPAMNSQPMRCEQVLPLIDGYADGETDLVRSLEMEEHLRRCESCANRYEQIQIGRTALRSAELRFMPPIDLDRRVRGALRKEMGMGHERLNVVRWQGPARWAGIAAALFLAAAVGWFARGHLGRSSDTLAEAVVASHVRSMMAQHLADVTSSDQHTVKPWFAGRLDFSPPVRDLAQQGFRLYGGRLDYIRGRPIAALIYRRRQHVINLLIWPAGDPAPKSPEEKDFNGYQVLHWTSSGMEFWAVSDLNSSELHEFADLLRGGAAEYQPTK